MANQEQQLKTLPHSVSKAQLVELYKGEMSKKEVLQNVTVIMIENRKGDKVPLSDEEIKLKKCIRHKEFTEFVETFGMPKGYF